MLSSSLRGRIIPPMDKRTRVRFWSNVEVHTETECWPWKGSFSSWGYGMFGFSDERWKAHRVMLALVGRPVPKGLVADHLCNNRACVNPNHLKHATERENILRGSGTSAQHSKQTHCKQGHLFARANTMILKNGSRRCKACDLERKRRGRRRKLAIQSSAAPQEGSKP